MSHDQSKRPGQLILQNLQLFDQAAVYFEREIVPSLNAELSNLFKNWLEEKLWLGAVSAGAELHEFWCAPVHWRDENQNWKAWFELDVRDPNETSSYRLASLFGLGDTQYGFRFCPEPSYFSDKRSWNKVVGALDANTGLELGKRGWVHEGKGWYFRSFQLSEEKIADAWNDDDWGYTFEALNKSLEQLAEDVGLFDQFLNSIEEKL
ncbi:hypothetical protein [Thalassospira marina]|uniref:Uncharacterized protein n=1 Tax=Thalassospira marina TaxID=2048283 RepID=A0ABM6QA99_9PROT|nr:hypothetical protein [Thalassospira marina]AUG53488.1 hypothetical protein CSC3H3_12765 [Thalassospira marina]